MIRAEGSCLLEHKGHLELVAGSVGSGLVSLHTKGMLPSGSCAVSKSWLGPGRGGLFSVNKAPGAKASRIQKMRKCNTGVLRGGGTAGLRSSSSRRG